MWRRFLFVAILMLAAVPSVAPAAVAIDVGSKLADATVQDRIYMIEVWARDLA